MGSNKEIESSNYLKSNEDGQLDLLLNIGGEKISELMLQLNDANVDIPQEVRDYINSPNFTALMIPIEFALTSVVTKDLYLSDSSCSEDTDEPIPRLVSPDDFVKRVLNMDDYTTCPNETALKLALHIATGKLYKNLPEGNYAYNVVPDKLLVDKMYSHTDDAIPCYLGVAVHKTKGTENNDLGKSKVRLYLWNNDGILLGENVPFLFVDVSGK